MFNFGRIEHLCRKIGVNERDMEETLDDFDTNPDAVIREFTVWPADPAKKSRDVISAYGKFRKIQQRLYHRLFQPRFHANRWSHGSVKARSAVTNARAHIGNTFAYVTDVSGFFPTISCKRVNKFFVDQNCFYTVAGALTRLCTYDFHLALGLITSPILANELFKPIDRRIAHACRKMNLTYTRFVDDIAISGKYDLQTSGIHGVVTNIVERNGFKLAQEKTEWGRLDGDITITGIRTKKHHLDASKAYVAELERIIADHINLAEDNDFTGPLLTEGELFGKCYFVIGLNSGRRRSLLGKLKTIDWKTIYEHAGERGLVRRREKVQRRGEPRPSCIEQLVTPSRAKNSEVSTKTTNIDASVAPF